jgi:hypothetical protein
MCDLATTTFAVFQGDRRFQEPKRLRLKSRNRGRDATARLTSKMDKPPWTSPRNAHVLRLNVEMSPWNINVPGFPSGILTYRARD